MYKISKLNKGYKLELEAQGIKKEFYVIKYIHALAIIQQLGMHLNEADKVLAA